ncbi:hypothetical protein Dsin_008260 [Dipteronia sinensis]|uniref:SWIM-type domain-containing protein n=1 Tax=Dipteronia sinensis TaxID=43782 RepID=A0AAE0APB6_9ROSI|nr:hypothetical protein Dsin_008260 [Dipteronia sinensis]
MDSSSCSPEYSGNYVYQVKENGGEQFVVNIEQKSCACTKWQLIGIPCIHGMAALLTSNRYPRGRPKKARILQSDEVMIGGKAKLMRNYIVVRCSKCGQRGHNKTTCDKRDRRNVAGSEAGNANGGGPQSVQPRQASTQTQHA